MDIVHYAYVTLMSVLTLGILIFVHELGHFLVAKWCGVAVLDFSIGFGKIIWQRQRGETLYALRLIPLGGYVRMLGDDPFEKFEAAEGDSDSATAEGGEIGVAPKPGGKGERSFTKERVIPAELRNDTSKHFLHQSILGRAAVVLAGPVFNFLFAIVAGFALAFWYGKPVPIKEPVIGHVTPGLPAEKAGILPGDRVLSLNGTAIVQWEELSKFVRASQGKELVLELERKDPSDGKVQTLTKVLTGTADNQELNVLDGTFEEDPKARPYRIGIAQSSMNVPVGALEALQLGVRHTWGVVTLTYTMLRAIVVGQIAASNALGGPVAVFAGAAQSAAAGFESVLNFLVLLSTSLAIFNLFPIPILDGGHLLFLLVESVKGSPVSVKWLAIANQVGLALLLGLMLFALSNDVIRLGNF